MFAVSLVMAALTTDAHASNADVDTHPTIFKPGDADSRLKRALLQPIHVNVLNPTDNEVAWISAAVGVIQANVDLKFTDTGDNDIMFIFSDEAPERFGDLAMNKFGPFLEGSGIISMADLEHAFQQIRTKSRNQKAPQGMDLQGYDEDEKVIAVHFINRRDADAADLEDFLFQGVFSALIDQEDFGIDRNYWDIDSTDVSARTRWQIEAIAAVRVFYAHNGAGNLRRIDADRMIAQQIRKLVGKE